MEVQIQVVVLIVGIVVGKVKTMDLNGQVDFMTIFVMAHQLARKVVVVIARIGHTILDVELLLLIHPQLDYLSQDQAVLENGIVCLLEILRMKIAILILSW